MNHKKTSHSKEQRNTNKAAPDDVKTPKFQLYRWQFTLKSMVKPSEPEKEYFESASSTASCASPIGSKLPPGLAGKFLDEAKELGELLKGFCKEWYMQLECGKTTGYIHYQGCLSLNNKEYMQTVKNLIGRNDVHLAGAKNWNALKNYNKKDETRILGPWSHDFVWIDTIEELFPWQQCVVDLVSTPCTNDRMVHWFYDEDGNKGKTQLAKYLAIKYGATVIMNGKFADIAQSIKGNPKVVLFLFPRTIEGRVNYSAIEAVKDGMIFSGKYESSMKIFNSPHVICMANFLPDESALSKDRWNIHYMYSEEKVSVEDTEECIPPTTLDGIVPTEYFIKDWYDELYL